MDKLLSFCTDNFWWLLILGFVFLFGVCGYFIDRNTNILSIEKKKKALREKSMNINEIKKKVKDKNVSLAGMSGGNDNVNVVPSDNVNTNIATANSNNSAEEDLTVPFNLNMH